MRRPKQAPSCFSVTKRRATAPCGIFGSSKYFNVLTESSSRVNNSVTELSLSRYNTLLASGQSDSQIGRSSLYGAYNLSTKPADDPSNSVAVGGRAGRIRRGGGNQCESNRRLCQSEVGVLCGTNFHSGPDVNYRVRHHAAGAGQAGDGVSPPTS